MASFRHAITHPSQINSLYPSKIYLIYILKLFSYPNWGLQSCLFFVKPAPKTPSIQGIFLHPDVLHALPNTSSCILSFKKYLMRSANHTVKLLWLLFLLSLRVIISKYAKLWERTLLRAFAKLRKADISFVKSVYLSVHPSVCLSVCPHGKTRFPLDGFSWNFIFKETSKICCKD
jgi:hypothetical protein